MKVKLTKDKLLAIGSKRIDDYINKHNQEVYTIDILAPYSHRTQKQIDFYWKLVDTVRKFTGDSKADIHNIFKNTFLSIDMDINDLDICDMSIYIQQVKSLIEKHELGAIDVDDYEDYND